MKNDIFNKLRGKQFLLKKWVTFALSREVLSFGENMNSENTFWNELGSGSVIFV